MQLLLACFHCGTLPTEQTRETTEMIVSSGTLKGRSLKTLGREPWLRPTSDKAREAVMDMLRPFLEGARFIDLCCGTGAVGIEAASNGAAHVTFIDTDVRSVRLVRTNISLLGLGERASIAKLMQRRMRADCRGASSTCCFVTRPSIRTCKRPFSSSCHNVCARWQMAVLS